MSVTLENLEMLHDWVLVRPDKPATQTEGGVLIADSAQEKPLQGVVVRVGPGVYRDGMFCETLVQVGETVLYPQFVVTERNICGEDLVLVQERDLYAVVPVAQPET